MAVSIGQVTQTTGKFIAIDANGQQRELHVGDSVAKGERIVAQGGSQIVITLENQQILTLDGQANTILDASVAGKELFAKQDVTVEGEEAIDLVIEKAVNADEVGETAAGQNDGQSAYISGGGLLNREASAGNADAKTSQTSYGESEKEEDEDTFLYDTRANGTDAFVTATVTSDSATGSSATGNRATATTTVRVDTSVTNANSTDAVTVSNDAVTNDNTVTVTGTTEAGATVVITDAAGNVVGTGTADEDGNYTIETSALEDGTQDLTVTVTDAAGNTATATTTVTVDTVGPVASTIDLDNDSDNITNDNTPTFSGNAEAGSDISIIIGGAVVGSVVADVNGDWSYTSDTLVDGDYTVSVDATDIAGNISSSTPIAVTVDTQATVSPGTSDISFDDGAMLITGAGSEAGNTIKLYDESNSVVATARVEVDGSWSIDISNLQNTPVNDNEFFKVTETDLAGNESVLSESTHFANYNWSNAQTDNFDDYDFAGAGDDHLSINDNDLNDQLVVDGGSGNDSVTFSGKKSDYEITTVSAADGKIYTVVTESGVTDSDGNGVGDVNELRNVETINFKDGTYDTVSGSFFRVETETRTESVTSQSSVDVAAMTAAGYTQNADGVWIGTTQESFTDTKTVSYSDTASVNPFDGFFSGMVRGMGHMKAGQGSGIISLGQELTAIEMGIKSYKVGNDDGEILLFREGEEEPVARISIDDIYEGKDNADTTIKVEFDGGFDSYQIEAPRGSEFKVGEPTLTVEFEDTREVSYEVDPADIIMETTSVETNIDILSTTDANINFDSISSLANSIEAIDLSGNGNQTITNLSVQDVLDITDSSNELVIQGDDTDKVQLDEGWQKTDRTETGGGDDYNVFEGSFGDSTVTLKIETNILLDDV